MKFAFIKAALIAGITSIFSVQSSAALIGTCTFGGGGTCAPDIALSASGTVSFDADGGAGGAGRLTITGVPANASFKAGQIKGASGAVTSVAISSVAPGDFGAFTFSMDVNASGALIDGSISIRGEVIDASTQDFGLITPSAGNLGGNPWLPLVSENIRGNGEIELTGDLAFGDLTQLGTLVTMGTSNVELDFDFRFDNDPSSIFGLAYSIFGAGVVELTTDLTDVNDIWNTDWTGSGVTFDVVVPIPGAGVLMVSALVGLFGVRIRSS